MQNIHSRQGRPQGRRRRRRRCARRPPNMPGLHYPGGSYPYYHGAAPRRLAMSSPAAHPTTFSCCLRRAGLYIRLFLSVVYFRREGGAAANGAGGFLPSRGRLPLQRTSDRSDWCLSCFFKSQRLVQLGEYCACLTIRVRNT